MIEILLGFLKWTCILVVSLILIGVLFEQFSRWKLEKTVLANHTFADVNSHAIHYVKKGKGETTVVFLSGMGSSHAVWNDIQEQVSKSTVTLSYDRSGIMYSGKSKEPVTNKSVSQELETLLLSTDCPKSVILVAHSMAAVYMRPFVEKHAQDIMGIILVEGAHPAQKKDASLKLTKLLSPPPTWLIRTAVHTGLYRFLFSFNSISPEIPFGHPLHLQERNFFYRSFETVLEELQQDGTNFEDAQKYSDLGNIPLKVIMGSSGSRYGGIKDKQLAQEYKDWVTSHQYALLSLSTDSELIEAPHSGHLVQIGDPDLVSKCVLELIKKGKS